MQTSHYFTSSQIFSRHLWSRFGKYHIFIEVDALVVTSFAEMNVSAFFLSGPYFWAQNWINITRGTN